MDAFQLITGAHVEDKTRPVSGKSKPVAQDIEQDKTVQIFVKRLLKLQLLGPLAVIALVGHVDTGFGHIEFIKHLHGFQLNITAAGKPGSDDVLGHLGMRARGDPERRFQQAAVAGHAEGVIGGGEKELVPVDAEYFIALFQISEDPGEQGIYIGTDKKVFFHGNALEF